MIDKVNNKCIGCSVCYNICPKKCITMEDLGNGFLYPKIDYKKCIKCNLCEKYCPINLEFKNNNIIDFKNKSFAAYSKDNNLRMKSSSGGIFSELAKYIINNNGIVVGAAFEDNNLRHIIVDKVEELYKLQGSKYLQSEMNDIYIKVKERLEKNKLVLFTGTPCEINALYKYLGKEYNNLYTQDIICHGVPSKLLYDKYKNYLENKSKSKVIDIKFRDKSNGWENYNIKIKFENGNIINEPANQNLYMKAFLNNSFLRPSCYECQFKGNNRKSDITLGDFWGINNIDSNFNDQKGLSLVIINTDKGNKLFNLILGQIIIKEFNINDSIKFNSSYYSCPNIPNEKDKFIEEIKNNDFEKVVNKYTKVSFLKRVKNKIKSIIK